MKASTFSWKISNQFTNHCVCSIVPLAHASARLESASLLCFARSDKYSILSARKRSEKKTCREMRNTNSNSPGLVVFPAAALVLVVFLLALATSASAATGQLSVTLERQSDSPQPNTAKFLASAVSDGWGEPPLGPGAVAFSFIEAGSSVSSSSSSSSSAADVHLGLAQATLLLPCGSKGKVKAAFTPTGAKEVTSLGAKAVEVARC